MRYPPLLMSDTQGRNSSNSEAQTEHFQEFHLVEWKFCSQPSLSRTFSVFGEVVDARRAASFYVNYRGEP